MSSSSGDQLYLDTGRKSVAFTHQEDGSLSVDIFESGMVYTAELSAEEAASVEVWFEGRWLA